MSFPVAMSVYYIILCVMLDTIYLYETVSAQHTYTVNNYSTRENTSVVECVSKMPKAYSELCTARILGLFNLSGVACSSARGFPSSSS